jgi:hypothetical protein
MKTEQHTPTTPNTLIAGNGRHITEAIDELDREAGVRRRCYDRWVNEGRLSKTDSADRLERLEAALAFLRAHAEHLSMIADVDGK